MNCQKCNKKLRAKYITFDYSEKCGIPEVTIDNVKQYTCKKCNEIYHDLGSVDEINQQLSNILLDFKSLTPAQARFVRSDIFQMNHAEFAKLIGTTAKHIRDVETYRMKFSKHLSKEIQNLLFRKTQRPRFIMGS